MRSTGSPKGYIPSASSHFFRRFSKFFSPAIRTPPKIRLNTLHPLFTPLTDVMIEGCGISTSGSTIEVITGANPIMLFTRAKDFFKFSNPCGLGQQFPFPVIEHWLHPCRSRRFPAPDQKSSTQKQHTQSGYQDRPYHRRGKFHRQ